MESNQVEATRAIDIAERKISENDYVGAKKLVVKAQTLYPNLVGLQQVMTVIDVYISASNKINGGREADWYGILGVDPLADEETVKKHYKKLALLLHPDKNKFTGATEAFKLVSEACCLLSDKAKRAVYDQQRTQKPQNPHKPASTDGNQDASDGARSNYEPACGTHKPPTPHKPAPTEPSNMESNEVAARRAIDIAERRISENDYIGAKKIVIKARTLYPNFDGLEQVLMMIDVYISASNKNKVGGESDWYGVLGVDPLADEETVKRKYKKLALLLHPDKNKCKGAEGAFKLVSEAWSLLSDKAKRAVYDQNRKSEQVTTWRQKQTNPSDKPAPAPVPTPVVNPSKGGSFWTMCIGCKTQCEYLRDRYLNKAIRCPNCGQTFIATEKTPSASFVMPVNFSSFSQQQRSAQNKATNKNTNAKVGQKKKRSSVSFTCSFPKSCSVSVSVTTSYSTGNATNKSQARSKRVVHEEPHETLSAAESVRKKLRRDVR